MEEIEREAIAQTLERTGGNVKRTAEILNYHRPRLYRKMKTFGLRGEADTIKSDVFRGGTLSHRTPAWHHWNTSHESLTT